MSCKYNKFISFILIVFIFANSFIIISADSNENYTLQASVLVDDSWIGTDQATRFSHYNCYAYAIGRIEKTEFYSNNLQFIYDPGDISIYGNASPSNGTI